MADMSYSGGSPIAGILMGFADRKREHMDEDFKSEQAYRASLIKQLDAIVADPQRWGPQSVQDALMGGYELRALPPNKNLPPEWKSKDGGAPERIRRIIEPVLNKELLQKGPAQPAAPAAVPEPPPVMDPGAPAMPPPPTDAGAGQGVSMAPGSAPFAPPPTAEADPNFSSVGAIPPELNAIFAGAQAQNAIPPQEGGQQLGPNMVSAAPAIPGQQAPPSAPAIALPPVAPQEFQVQDRGLLSYEDLKRREANAADISNVVTMPDGSTVDKRVLTTLRADKDREARMYKLGRDADGNLLTEDRVAPADRAKVKLMQAQEGLVTAQEELTRAKATGVPSEVAAKQRVADAAYLRAQAALSDMGSGSGGGTSRLGQYSRIVDQNGMILGFYNPKTNDWKDNPVEGGRVSGLPTTELTRRGMLEIMSRQLDNVERVAKEHKDNVGGFLGWKGKVTSLKNSLGGADPDSPSELRVSKEESQMFREVGNIRDALLRARSGAQINETEYDRLSKLIPDPTKPNFWATLGSFKQELRIMVNTTTGNSTPKITPPGGPPKVVTTEESISAAPPVKTIPRDKRIAGVTKGMLNGSVHVWDGQGWVPE